MPATRISNKRPVILKQVPTDKPELQIMLKLSSGELGLHPRNRFISLLDVILMPDTDEHAFAVLPQLHPIERPLFQSAAELLHCFRRYLQVSKYNHVTGSGADDTTGTDLVT
jgi:hypothetical protein